MSKFKILATFWRDEYPGVAINVISDRSLSWIGPGGVDEQWSAEATSQLRAHPWDPLKDSIVDVARTMLEPDREEVWFFTPRKAER